MADLNICILVAIPAGVNRVRARTGWLTGSIKGQDETASLIRSFHLSVVARQTARAGPTPRYSLGR